MIYFFSCAAVQLFVSHITIRTANMPSAIPIKRERITKFTNCRLLKGDKLVNQDLWVSSATGKILKSQEVFYSQQIVPDATVNLGGRIISPGLIDVQLNGAFGFDFSSVPDDMSIYGKTLREVNKLLIQTGVTAYLPTLTSQRKEVYHKVSAYSFHDNNDIISHVAFKVSDRDEKV